MKKNVLTLYDYQDLQMENSFPVIPHHSFIVDRIFLWISYLIDTLTTIAITGCTIFCCYLAWTML